MSVSDKYTLKPSLCASFGGIIWKVETDERNSIVAIESRSVADRITHFSAFNYATGECLFKEVTVENGWFWSIDRIYDNMLLLHSYVNESNPEHKGIIAIDRNGEVAWQQFHKTLYDVTEEGLVIYNPKIQPKMLESISGKTGDTISGNINQIRDVPRNILVPEIISYPEIIALLPQDLAGPAVHCACNGKDIVAFHTQHNELYNQQLAVYQDQVLILEDYLAQDIQKLNPEAFFIERNHLFYIRNSKQEFVSYLV